MESTKRARGRPRKPAGAFAPHELEAIRLAAFGYTNREIAAFLGIQERSVRTYFHRAKAPRRAMLVPLAVRLQLVTMEELFERLERLVPTIPVP